MSSKKPTIDFKVIAEEKKYLIAERERKAKEAEKEALRAKRNNAAITNEIRLKQGIFALERSTATLIEEIDERSAEIKEGDILWRRGSNEIGARVKAKSGFTAAQNLRTLCRAVHTGFTLLIDVTSMGLQNVNTHGFEKSVTLMSACRASPVVGSNVATALEKMCEIMSEFVKTPADEEVEVVGGKRKRV